LKPWVGHYNDASWCPTSLCFEVKACLVRGWYREIGELVERWYSMVVPVSMLVDLKFDARAAMLDSSDVLAKLSTTSSRV